MTPSYAPITLHPQGFEEHQPLKEEAAPEIRDRFFFT
jgi:hypothetical protein